MYLAMREELEGVGEDPAKEVFRKKVKPFVKTSPKQPITDWEQIKEAVQTRNKQQIKRIGASYGRPRIVQEGLRPDEVAQQILSLAPGNVLVGPLMLDLAEKL